MMRRTVLAAALAGLIMAIGCSAIGAPRHYVDVAGSNTMLPAARLWAGGFEEAHPSVDVRVKGGGTGVGIAMLIAGKCDVACASFPALPQEMRSANKKGVRLRMVKVARDRVAIVVSPDSTIRCLTLAQCKSVFSGAIANWQHLGGPNLPIVPVGRDYDSGTQKFMRQAFFGGKPFPIKVLRMPTNLAVCQTVSRRRGAIGYASAAYALNYAGLRRIRILPIATGKGEAAMPTAEAVIDGTYPLSRFVYIYTREKTRPQVKEFMKFVLSPKGQKLGSEAGLVPLPNTE